jgi:hypothetical protein
MTCRNSQSVGLLDKACRTVLLYHSVTYMKYMGVMVYMDCTLINYIQFLVHPEQPPVHADKFDVPHDPLELLHAPVLVQVVHGGHGGHGLHPDQLYILLSLYRKTSCSC